VKQKIKAGRPRTKREKGNRPVCKGSSSTKGKRCANGQRRNQDLKKGKKRGGEVIREGKGPDAAHVTVSGPANSTQVPVVL